MIEALQAFAADNGFRGKGPLSVALVVTGHARALGLPLDATALTTANDGQVLGLGRSGVQAVLERHGITKVLASEGGRTSRGSIANMRAYVSFLNDIALARDVDLDLVEAFWIDRVRAHFAAKPFQLRIDPSLSVRAIVRALMDQVEVRQREASGAMVVGTVMQHLVGAKLQIALQGRATFEHNGSNTNDVKGRGGDFDIGDVSFHITTAPGPAVIEKCRSNLDAGRRPIIVTTRRRTEVAEALAIDAELGGRLDIIDFEQFITTNIYEIGVFAASGRADALADIIAAYNTIIDVYETDPSLRIELGTRR